MKRYKKASVAEMAASEATKRMENSGTKNSSDEQKPQQLKVSSFNEGVKDKATSCS